MLTMNANLNQSMYVSVLHLYSSARVSRDVTYTHGTLITIIIPGQFPFSNFANSYEVLHPRKFQNRPLRGFCTNCVFICSDGLGWIVFSHLNFDDRRTSGQSAGIAFPRLNFRPPSAPVRSLGGDDDDQERKF